MKQNQQAQNQPKTTQGGDAMKQNQPETKFYFVTFTRKLEKEKAKKVISELYKIFPGKTPVFMSKPPAGKKIVMNVGGVLVILTFPYPNRQETHSQSSMQEHAPSQEGFTLRDLIKNKT